MAKDFRTRCDYKRPTICLFKIKDGDCIGGYKKGSNESSLFPNYAGNICSMLFNLSCKSCFPCKKSGKDKCCSSDHEPSFGVLEDGELVSFKSPFNGYGNCKSTANSPGYGIPVDALGTNMLTKEMDGQFTISELEIWEVFYLDAWF